MISEQLIKIHKDAYRVQIEVLEGGRIPTKAHPSDSGFDLYTTEDIVIEPGKIIKHPLNIKIALPPNTYAQIESRSSLGSKGFLPLAKIIDRGYTGVPHIVATNVGSEVIHIKKGDRIAQMIIHTHSEHYFMQQVDQISSNTDRSDGGFGSSGQ